MVRLVNRTGKFLSQLKSNDNDCLQAIGMFCTSKMNELVPVDTGFLRSRNTFRVQNHEVMLMNDCYYCIYVEMGTYKMPARPFMRRSATNYLGEVKAIIQIYMSRGM